MLISELKADLRKKVLAKRIKSHRNFGEVASDSLSQHLLAFLKKKPARKVAGYWATGSEMNLTALLFQLDAEGWSVSLPVVIGNETSLIFRRWRRSDHLSKGPFKTLQTKPESEELIPEIILVPLIAFDGEHYRLGQGGGFYDRTLQKFAKHDIGIVSVGIAFASQQVDVVPRDEHDYCLDFVVTENGFV